MSKTTTITTNLNNNPFNLIYTSNPDWPLANSSRNNSNKLLKISVLDSSFNPPHKAHLALATTRSNDAESSFSFSLHASLLVLSVKNVDKIAKEGVDASYEQRLEMMKVMATEIKQNLEENVAVVCINEPSFVGKSKVIKAELEKLLSRTGEEGSIIPVVQLCFSQGWDTLIRFFDPKYYQPPSAPIHSSLASFFLTDQSTITCARRGDITLEQEETFLSSKHVKEWRDKVTLFDLDDKLKDVSSTEVRKIIGEETGKERDEKLKLILLESVKEIIDRDELYRKKSNL